MTESDIDKVDRVLDGLRGNETDDELLARLAAVTAIDWPERAAGDRIAQAVMTAARAASPGMRNSKRRAIVAAAAAMVAAAAIVVAAGHAAAPPYRATFTATLLGTVRPAPAAERNGSRWQLVSYFPVAAWSAGSLKRGNGFGLSCPDARTCYLTAAHPATWAGNVVAESRDSGASWVLREAPAGVSFTTPLQCPGPPTTCVAGGVDGGVTVLLATSDGGQTWSAHPVPGADVVLDLLSCTSARDCVTVISERGPALGIKQDVLVTTDGGNSFRRGPATPGGQYPDMLACSGRSCVLIDQKAGTDTSPSVNGNGTPAVGAGQWSAFYSRDGGYIWRPATRAGHFWPEFSNDTPMPGAVSCPDSLHCRALASTSAGTGGSTELIATSDGGATWTDITLPAGPGNSFFADALSCPTIDQCWVGGQAGTHDPASALLTTSNAGETWQFVTLPASVLADTASKVMTTGIEPGIAEISCPAANLCTALMATIPGATTTPVLRLSNG
jgi:photosystem II stability/assembly factor-like uncharacterized protein